MTTRAFRYINDAFASRFVRSWAGSVGQVLYAVAATIMLILAVSAFYSANVAAGGLGLLVLASGMATVEWFARDRERT